MSKKPFTYERTQEDEDFITKAARYAEHIHRDQVRKSIDGSGSTPYFDHLEHVAKILRDHQASTIEIVAGYLHDSVEDQGGDSRALDIKHHFGEQVLEIVLGCTDSTSTNPDDKKPWEQRKRAYIKGLKSHPVYICRVSAADKISNMTTTIADAENYGPQILSIFGRSIKDNTLTLAQRREKTLWYHRSIGDVFKARSKDMGKISLTYADTFRTFEDTLLALTVN